MSLWFFLALWLVASFPVAVLAGRMLRRIGEFYPTPTKSDGADHTGPAA